MLWGGNRERRSERERTRQQEKELQTSFFPTQPASPDVYGLYKLLRARECPPLSSKQQQCRSPDLSLSFSFPLTFSLSLQSWLTHYKSIQTVKHWRQLGKRTIARLQRHSIMTISVLSTRFLKKFNLELFFFPFFPNFHTRLSNSILLLILACTCSKIATVKSIRYNSSISISSKTAPGQEMIWLLCHVFSLTPSPQFRHRLLFSPSPLASLCQKYICSLSVVCVPALFPAHVVSNRPTWVR